MPREESLPQVLSDFWKDLLQETANLVLQKPSIEETHAMQFKIQTNPLFYSKEGIPVGERKWSDILACESFEGDSLHAEISKLVMRLVRHHDQDEQETDGAFHWNSMGPKLRRAFLKAGGRKFSDTDWLVKEATR